MGLHLGTSPELLRSQGIPEHRMIFLKSKPVCGTPLLITFKASTWHLTIKHTALNQPALPAEPLTRPIVPLLCQGLPSGSAATVWVLLTHGGKNYKYRIL